MKISRHQGLSRQAAGHGDPIDIEPFIPVKAKFLGNEMWIVNNAEACERDAQVLKFLRLGTRDRPQQQQREQDRLQHVRVRAYCTSNRVSRSETLLKALG